MFGRKRAKLTGKSREGSTSSDATVYMVGYSLYGDDLPDWMFPSQFKTLEEVLSDVDEGFIKSFGCEGKVPPLTVVCPLVEQLLLADIPDDCQLESLSTLNKLEVLELHGNNFSAGLPEVVGELRSLTELHLRECQLSDLPACLSTLTKLEQLVLRVNDFSAGLPEVVGELRSLTSLNLERCQLSDLPACLSTLNKLEVLDLEGNKFSAGLPEVVGELRSLTSLSLERCQLSGLPAWFGQLRQLVILGISGNNFSHVPPPVFLLTELREIDLSSSYELTRISEQVLRLKNLENLKCEDCPKLVSPPYAVCVDGLKAIRDYFVALGSHKEAEVCIAPVAIVGNSLAGKTSIRKSLQQGKRVLTSRAECDTSLVDETTKVFEIHKLVLPTSTANLIDYGGQEIYHISYQYVLKESSIPLFVVSFKQFLELSKDVGSKVAARRVCWDWMSHIYLACPLLGRPLLVFTHADGVSDQSPEVCKEKFLELIEQIRKEMLAEEVGFRGKNQGEFQKILHLSNTETHVFHHQEVFIFSDDELETSNIEKLKTTLEERCQEFKTKIPRSWSDITEFVTSQSERSFIDASIIEEKYSVRESHSVLRYMHNSGSILWYNQHDSLRKYIFHQIAHIAEMICLLYDHKSKKTWKERLAVFTAFRYQDRMISKDKYQDMVEEFMESGMLDAALLYHLLADESSKFPSEISFALLKGFKILHGPVRKYTGEYYLIPCLSSTSMDGSWETDGELQLRLEVELGGLPVPIYGFQLATVQFLNTVAAPRATIKARKNGATVYHGRNANHFIHVHREQRMTIQVSTSTQQLTASWKRLIETTQLILEYITSIWKSCQPSIRVFCSHCLYLRDPRPSAFVDPDWLCPIFSTASENSKVCQLKLKMEILPGLDLVFCRKQHSEGDTDGMPAIPSSLIYPCYHLTADETEEVINYLSQVVSQRHTSHVTPKPSNTSNASTSSKQDVSRKRAQLPPLPKADGDDSELSDDLGYLDDENYALTIISLRVKPSKRSWAKELFGSPSVYRMTSPVRGRCLIINNMKFTSSDGSGGSQKSERSGSQNDATNIEMLFKSLSFASDEIHADLSAQDMLRVIHEDTKVPDHENYGMFVLVIMTHGSETHLYGSDCQPILCTDVYNLLSPQNFPLMAGKPKLLILQACSGGRYDAPYGNNSQSTSSQEPTPAVTPASLPSTSTAQSTNDETADNLAGDDFFIMTPSFAGHIANRVSDHGSFFIRALVEAFYKHSCHRDVKRLFEEQITKKVRAKSIEVNKKYPHVSRQQPTITCYPTDGKKLYLFPGYNPPPPESQ